MPLTSTLLIQNPLDISPATKSSILNLIEIYGGGVSEMLRGCDTSVTPSNQSYLLVITSDYG